MTVTQLLRLAHSINPNQFFGYYVLGKPLGALFQVAAMILTLIGAHRYWRQQMSMARGKVWASGWEIYVIWSLLLVVSDSRHEKEKRTMADSDYRATAYGWGPDPTRGSRHRQRERLSVLDVCTVSRIRPTV